MMNPPETWDERGVLTTKMKLVLLRRRPSRSSFPLETRHYSEAKHLLQIDSTWVVAVKLEVL